MGPGSRLSSGECEMDGSTRPPKDEWPFPPIEVPLHLASTALLVIDMQHFDASRGYGVGPTMFERAPRLAEYYFDRVDRVVVPNIARLLEAFRGAKARVIYVTLGAELDDLADLPAASRARSRKREAAVGRPTFYPRSSFECQIIPSLAPLKGELVVNKTSLGAFNSTLLDLTLRNLGIETLVITGVVTTACIETTARDAADRGFNVVIAEDGCAAWDEESHRSTLRAFSRHFGRVDTVEHLLQVVRSGGDPAT